MGVHCRRVPWRVAVAFPILIGGFSILAQEAATAPSSPNFRVTRLQLPDANGVVALDYFAYDRRSARIWLPASNLGFVAVIDAQTDKLTTLAGFKTGEVELLGKKRLLGPTSVTIGDGVVYIGNRGDSSICVVDAGTLTLVNCQRIGDPAAGLARAPDAVVYVATTKELWVTTGAPPLGIAAADNALLILDAADPKHIKAKRTLSLGASAEGYAVDNKRGLFYTSLEESGETVAIDVRRKKVASRWRSGCAEPHGVALDDVRRFLFVACADRVIVGCGSQQSPRLDQHRRRSRQHRLLAARAKAVRRCVDRGDAYHCRGRRSWEHASHRDFANREGGAFGDRRRRRDGLCHRSRGR